MPVSARRPIRRMRGGAQAWLTECDDGRWYVVKFRNNPQHRRILVNEWVAGVFLQYLGIAAPETAIVFVTAGFINENPDVSIQLGSKRIPAEPGRHFGSLHPGDPDRMAVYDFIPDALLKEVANLRDFLGMLVVDKWLANADARQSIFFRARVRHWAPAPGSHALKQGFIAQMIDHGYVFDGPHWTFSDSPICGLYSRALVYDQVRGLGDFQPWLDQVVHFPEEVVDDACRQVPREWIEGEEDQFQALLERLLKRRKQVPRLIEDCRAGRGNPFPNWR